MTARTMSRNVRREADMLGFLKSGPMADPGKSPGPTADGGGKRRLHASVLPMIASVRDQIVPDGGSADNEGSCDTYSDT